MSQVPCLHEHLANAARVTYPAALQRCKLDAPLLAAGLLTEKAYNGSYTAQLEQKRRNAVETANKRVQGDVETLEMKEDYLLIPKHISERWKKVKEELNN